MMIREEEQREEDDDHDHSDDDDTAAAAAAAAADDNDAQTEEAEPGQSGHQAQQPRIVLAVRTRGRLTLSCNIAASWCQDPECY
jgi:hypothetical protein